MLKLDRMFRNAGDCLTTVEQWEKAGVVLHVVDLYAFQKIIARPSAGL